MNRREFLGLAAGAVAVGGCTSMKQGEEKGRMLFGACRGLGDAKLMKEVGYDFVECGVGDSFQPDKSEAQWQKKKDEILGAALPLRSCNGFIPGKFRLTGPAADHAPALDYAEIACRRADQVGCKCLVFGSGGARNVPGDFCAKDRKGWPDLQKGRDQYRDFCAALAKRISDCRVTVVIEPLCPNESNIVNYVWQGMQIVDEVNSPRIRQLADFYHMLMGLEDAASIRRAGAALCHCHIAEKTTRTAPGLQGQGEEFMPYFAALREIGYTGGVSCECRWGSRKTFRDDLVRALDIMKRLAGQV